MKHANLPIYLLFAAALAALILAVPQAVWACGGGVICVDAGAAGAATGLSWTDAYTNVQDALAAASYGDEIWVAQGVYYPDEGVGQTDNDREATFTLRPGVAIYGGFAGTESTLNLRDPTTHITVLSGDIDGNDLTNATGIVTNTDVITGSNAYHVVTSLGVTETAQLDGFIITAGNANKVWPYDFGGGMLNEKSNPTLSYIIFSGNLAATGGGGIHNDQSTTILTQVTFSNNRAKYGGGMYNFQKGPTLTEVIFSGNQAEYGGGMNNTESAPKLTGVIFSNNIATENGGGMNNLMSDPILTNVTFDNNQARLEGGGMYNDRNRPTMTNTTFSSNQASMGGGLFNDNSNPIMINSSFRGNLSN